jgi:hypothetical protein
MEWINNMVHKEIKFGRYGKSATVLITGDSGEVVITLLRGSKVISRNDIHLNPKGITERFFPSWIPPKGKYDRSKEGKFRARITRCLEVMSEVASLYVKEDDEEERQGLEKKRLNDQNQMEIEQFIESTVQDMYCKPGNKPTDYFDGV